MEANRKTPYAWLAVGALACVVGLAAVVRLWDSGARAQSPEPPVAPEIVVEKAAPPPSEMPPSEGPLPPPGDVPPAPLPDITPVKAEEVAPPPPPGGLPTPPPPPTGSNEPLAPPLLAPPPPAITPVKAEEIAPPPTGSNDRPIIIPGGKPAPNLMPVQDHGQPLPPIEQPPAPPVGQPTPQPPPSVPPAPPPVVKPPQVTSPVAPVATRSYTVRTPGMTVKKLARQVLGSADRWPDICNLNSALTENSTLSVGATVNLPWNAVVREESEVTPLPMLRARPAPKPQPVLPLTGTYPVKLDDKGNLILPPAVLSQLDGCSTVLLSPGSDRCLWLTNQSHLDRLSEKLDRSPARESDVQAFKRLYYAQVVKATVQGDRVRVSARLTDFAGLSEDAVLVGIDDHFEVWDLAKWRKFAEERKGKLDAE